MEIAAASKNKIAVINKSDLETRADTREIEKELGQAVCLSALTGEGIEALIAEIEKMFDDGTTKPDGEILTNSRQADGD